MYGRNTNEDRRESENCGETTITLCRERSLVVAAKRHTQAIDFQKELTRNQKLILWLFLRQRLSETVLGEKDYQVADSIQPSGSNQQSVF